MPLIALNRLSPVSLPGAGLTPEQESAVDSIVNLPDNAVPKAVGGKLESSVASSDVNLDVEGSVQVDVGSVLLGGAQSMSAIGENVAFQNLVSELSKHPTWQTFADGNTSVSRVRTTLPEITVSDKTADLVDPVWDNGVGASVDQTVKQVIFDFVTPVTDLVIRLDLDGVEFYKSSFGAFATGEQVVTLNPPLDVEQGQLVTFNFTDSAGGSITLKGSNSILDTMGRPIPFQKATIASWVDEDVTLKKDIGFGTFDANDALYPSINPAVANSRNGHPILSFDDTVAENVILKPSVPVSYTGRDISIDIDWIAESAITGGVTWGIEIERNAPGGDDIDSDSFAAQQTGTSTTNGTSGIITRTTIVLTQAEADGIEALDSFRVRLQRVVGDAGDDMIGDAQIIKVGVR